MTRAKLVLKKISDQFGSNKWDQVIELFGEEIANDLDHAIMEMNSQSKYDLQNNNVDNKYMKLFKVSASGKIEWIIALNIADAMSKFGELNPSDRARTVSCKFICVRDHIIPTIDPIQEFSK